MARLLKEAGFPEASILQENTGTDTLSSVRAVARLVRGQSPVYACTSAYHLPRCLILLRLAGIAARPCPPPPVAGGDEPVAALVLAPARNPGAAL